MIVPQLGCKVFADWPKGRQGPSPVCFFPACSCQINTCCLSRSTHDHSKATCFTPKLFNFGKSFQLKRKEIGDFIDKYFTRANPSPDDEIIETDGQNDVLEPKSVTIPRNLMYQRVLNITIQKN